MRNTVLFLLMALPASAEILPFADGAAFHQGDQLVVVDSSVRTRFKTKVSGKVQKLDNSWLVASDELKLLDGQTGKVVWSHEACEPTYGPEIEADGIVLAYG